MNLLLNHTRYILVFLFISWSLNAQVALPTFQATHYAGSGLYSFSSHTFTNCGATGKNGPTLSNCTSAYSPSWTDNTNYFNVPSNAGIQYWTVPSTGSYQIEVWGAQGGRGGVDDPIVEGGAGAKIRGTISLTQGTVMKILVGQKGLGGGNMKGGGGGGGSFVATDSNSPLIAAGGGGGGSYHSTHPPGEPSRIGGTGNITLSSSTTAGSAYNASGGAGFISNSVAGTGGGIAISFTNGGTGATGVSNHDGGFGGGGGGSSSWPSGGGGGGYQGGNASRGSWSAATGQSKGGYSYNSGTDKADSSTLGYNSDQGKVIIIKL